jgi:arylsulfatase A-like enzyme
MGASHPTVQALAEFFARGRDPGRPLFLFANLTEAHMPYLSHWPDEASAFFPGQHEWENAINVLFPDAGQALMARNYGGAPLAGPELAQLQGLYRAALRRVDRITEALLAAVDAHCDPRNTLVFVLSDHGENLGEHGHLSHIFNLYESNLRIPLIVRGPGFAAGARETRPARIDDLYPTILRAAGLEPEPGCSGLDLHAAPGAQRTIRASLERPVVSLGTFPESLRRSGALARFDRTLESARLGSAKLIQAGDGSCERYDLARDPGELNVLPELPEATQQALSAEIARALALWESRRSFEVQGRATSDTRTRAALKQLGYTGDEK